MSVLRPNYRRARALALELEAAQNQLEVETDPDHREDLLAETQTLEREFFLTGVTSEYDL